jgi:predicted lysophospholipase L1 biosynthesis ABC-type transport system permease subunit
MLEGRPATEDDEIVVGTTTLRHLGKEIGDRVHLTLGGEAAIKVIVGRAVFPSFGFSDAARTALGDGVALTTAGLIDLAPDSSTNAALVRLVAGPGKDATLHGLREDFADRLTLFAYEAQQPGAIVEYERVQWTPYALAGLLALLAAGALTHSLVSTSRRRRRDVAVLQALGFTRHQVGGTIRWHASTVVAIGLLVGIPAGLVLGRVTWELFAGRVGVPAAPVAPLVAVAVLIPGALLVANVLAAIPARGAMRTRPAVALRSE